MALLVVGLGACWSGPSGPPAATPATPEPTEVAVRPLNLRDVPAPSLEGNLLGDPAEREVLVYLPPQYFESDDALPVVYYLPGFTEEWITGVQMPDDLDTAFATVDPMIVAVVSGVTSVGGSFFVDSPANGDWETFVTEDVVDYVDENFRTLAAAETRGITGYGMGGFGALNLGMRHPDVFGAVYATTPGLLDADGVADMGFFDSEAHVAEMVDTLEHTGTLDGAEVGETLGDLPYLSQLELAYGLAFSPATDSPYLAFPYARTGGVVTKDDAVWSAWDAGFGDWDQKVPEFRDNLASLSGIGFDCPSNDEFTWIPQGCAYLDAQLTTAGIDHQYTVTTGGHEDASGRRITEGLLPFMAAHVAAEPAS
ncbi:alpha/beta hydrolase [Cellulomonas sp. URHB0016]